MTTQKSKISLRRTIRLFFIVNGCLLVLGIFALIIIAYSPVAHGLFWRIRHGSTATLEGHAFHVPFAYDVESKATNSGFDITEYPGLFGGLSSVTLESGRKVLDANEIAKWQNNVTTALNKATKTPDQWSPETIHGRQLTFTCVHEVMQELGETILCHVAGTDLSISTMASTKYIHQTRQILETSN